MTVPPAPLSTSKRLPRWPFVLLGLMTIFTIGGPVAIGLALQGGSSSKWPPDRPLEWVVFVGVCAMVVVLMAACCSLALVTRKRIQRPPQGPGAGSSRVEP